MNEDDALLALHLVPNLGPVRIRRLISEFSSAQAVLEREASALQRVPGIGSDLAQAIRSAKSDGGWEAEKQRAAAIGAWLLPENDSRYPQFLKQLPNAPVLLQVLGTLTPADQHALSIVGSRHCTLYGTECAKRFGFQLAYAGLTIVSGLARGIDTAAHLGALAAKGRTIAVIGSGLGDLYPPENRTLAERIAKHGAVVSEFPMDFPPTPQTFPYRNRIVAGWAKGIVVVEAGIKSGALITANLALENGRHVYAIPGPIDRTTSGGSNRLIQQGAKLVTSPEDILEDLQELFPIPRSAPPLGPVSPKGPPAGADASPEERLLLSALQSTERGVDELIQTTGLPASQVGAALLSLELKRMVKALPGNWYRIA
ncbi:MAG: DNA-protecting protein DprA [Verrucomicrobiota bacterium]|jgi:DNA processing protein